MIVPEYVYVPEDALLSTKPSVSVFLPLFRRASSKHPKLKPPAISWKSTCLVQEMRKLGSKEKMSYLRAHRLGRELGVKPRTPVFKQWSDPTSPKLVVPRQGPFYPLPQPPDSLPPLAKNNLSLIIAPVSKVPSRPRGSGGLRRSQRPPDSPPLGGTASIFHYPNFLSNLL